MRAELVENLVDDLSLCVESEADEVELGGGDRGDGGAVRLVVRGCEEVVGEDGEPFDVPRHRALVSAAKPGSVSGVDEDRLPAHRQVVVAAAIDIGLPDERRVGPGDAADEEGGHVRLLPDGELLVEDDRDLGVELHA